VARIRKFSNVSVNTIYRFVSASATSANATTFDTKILANAHHELGIWRAVDWDTVFSA
jgi:hypothetical protein